MKKVLLGLLIVLSVLICCVSCVFFDPKPKDEVTFYCGDYTPDWSMTYVFKREGSGNIISNERVSGDVRYNDPTTFTFTTDPQIGLKVEKCDYFFKSNGELITDFDDLIKQSEIKDKDGTIFVRQ